MKKIRIGAVVNTISRPGQEVLRGMERRVIELTATHPKLVMRFFLGSGATTMENVCKFVASGLDVVVFCGMEHSLVMQFIKESQGRVPVVLAAYSPLSEEDFEKFGNGGVVLLDNEAVGRRAADYFITHGMRNFAFIGRKGNREDVAGDVRQKAYHDRIAESMDSRMSYDKKIIGESAANEDYWEVDQEKIGEWIASLPRPCGIFVNGASLARRVAGGCRRNGIPVPEQVEVLGVDDFEVAPEDATPAVTSIVPAFSEFSLKIVDMALAVARGTRLDRESRLVVVGNEDLKERGTTAIGRGYGHVAARAQEFIRANACNGITVIDVARGLGVSRRTLEVRLREGIGKTVHQLISEVRMDEVCRLLKNTDLRISEVIVKAGYSLTTNAFVLFKKLYGVTMREYRKQNRVN